MTDGTRRVNHHLGHTNIMWQVNFVLPLHKQLVALTNKIHAKNILLLLLLLPLLKQVHIKYLQPVVRAKERVDGADQQDRTTVMVVGRVLNIESNGRKRRRCPRPNWKRCSPCLESCRSGCVGLNSRMPDKSTKIARTVHIQALLVRIWDQG